MENITGFLRESNTSFAKINMEFWRNTKNLH